MTTETRKLVRQALENLFQETPALWGDKVEDGVLRHYYREDTIHACFAALKALDAEPAQPAVSYVCVVCGSENGMCCNAIDGNESAQPDGVRRLGEAIDNAYCEVVRDAAPKRDADRMLTHLWVCGVLNHLKEMVNALAAPAPACKTCGGSKWVTPKANGAIDMGIVSGDPRPCPDCNAGEVEL